MSAFARIVCICVLITGILAVVHAAKPSDVVVIINDKSSDSREVGTYYVKKRGIPAKNVCHIECPATEEISEDDFEKLIRAPVKSFLAKTGLRETADYLVLTKGIPFKTKTWAMSVDSVLMCMDLGLEYKNLKKGVPNPYFGKDEHFSHNKYSFYLATRLDGRTTKVAKALVDRALAAKPEKGIFIFDTTPARNSGDYRVYQFDMKRAHDNLIRKGFISYLDESRDFVGGRNNIMGYISWGSNDECYDMKLYRSNRFRPGAIGDTAVSSSARTFGPYTSGQSLIADLIDAGITGVKGYVSEPFVSAIASPTILFDRYLSGYNLAESFWMASRYIVWKDIVIGDPLCAPYAKK